MSQQPDNTALRTALWRALHVQIDAQPPILKDEIGLRLIAPDDGWQERPDMKYTKRLRASIIARARFIEDLAKEQIENGICQYVILGSGLDSFVQRNPALASKIQTFEIDQPSTLEWKQKRLVELGFGVPEYLHFIPVDFEISSWWDLLRKSKFDIHKRSFVACTGVSLYLTKETIIQTLRHISGLTKGSKLAMTFYLPIEMLDEEDRPSQERANKGAEEAGTPFISFFRPQEVVEMAIDAGFNDVKIISTKEMQALYFKGRKDHLLPASGELFLLATI
ncbi:MAG TPA: class I SAM-dependent methyltransferase [Arachidicoccus soli]|uniref:S-adenosyl-L-methionine-dependent methyltransferase n=1 Tax=Arachidicoccus soli TaxID=2341117 RepID=A0A386HN80_9BACT|nr:class I SAM-dependent methyltransferase [Arachidicoccus soli]AYD46794.1 SAM-dependent methyltransferase [Arachidicoccus soli]HEU0226190.1 class I SAM-dependent methyltransferase [Arachidicoccus soli]